MRPAGPGGDGSDSSPAAAGRSATTGNPATGNPDTGTPATGNPDTAADLVLRVSVDAAEAELTADLLWSHGATAVEESAADDGTTVLVAGFPTPAAVHAVGSALPAGLLPEVVTIEDRSWRDAWRAHAAPVTAGAVTVVPAWRPVRVKGDGLVIEIDPGACFGSGSHPSTRMLLAELGRRVTGGETVLDVGTGSGILAVAAARLGAGRVVAIDIEAEALAVTRLNADRNGVAEVISTTTEWPAGVFDLVLVNVTAAVQAELASRSVAALRSGGALLLAGLLPGQWAHVAERFVPLAVAEHLELDGWAGAVLTRTEA